MTTTNSPRRYSSELRRQQAEQTRARIVAAAAEIFSERGYTATTLAQIAQRAGVSVETVQNNGPKAGLLRAAIDVVSFGAAPDETVLDTERGATFLGASGAEEAIAISAGILAAVNGAAHGVWMAFSEAARSDEALADELRALADGVRAQNVLVLEVWRSRGWLRDDMEFEDLVDRSALAGSVEVYDRFVRLGGRTADEYQAMIAGVLADLLLAR